MVYKYFLFNLTHVGGLTLWKGDVLNCYITLKCIICNKVSDDWIWYSKLNMVYLAELLVVMTDGLKIVRIRARNVHHTRTQVLRWRRVSPISLSLQESDGVAWWCAKVTSSWNIKSRLWTTCACLAVVSEQESWRNSMPCSLWHQIWAIWL